MTVISQALSLAKTHVDRLPVSMGGWFGEGLGLQTEASTLAHLNAMGGVGWLFAVVDRISTAVAATEWKLFRTAPNGDRKEITKHPLLDLWESVNPFYTQPEFLETGGQHFELTGEMWWVLLRNGAGRPVEMWPIRPDRMTVVPSRDQYIAGYIYRVGQDAIPLPVNDVILIRRPHPINPYRGIGTLQSIMVDIATERESSLWTRNFFKNNAAPGGIIEVTQAMSDDQFEKFVMRWQTQHQGVANAHRVAILENATWKDRKLSQRDMQFEQLKRVNRDIIIGAFGVPLSVMGITESVNRANAEAGEVTFTKWTVVPRLVRIRAAVNERLVPQFGSDLELDFVDPTPTNRELALEEATRGYDSGYLTQNEARARLGESEQPGGESFKPTPITLSVTRNKAPDNDLIRPEELVEEQNTMESRWAKRLKGEGDALAEFLGSL